VDLLNDLRVDETFESTRMIRLEDLDLHARVARSTLSRPSSREGLKRSYTQFSEESPRRLNAPACAQVYEPKLSNKVG
jgi:hypothetical protein